jgi:hypothetical protein
VPHSLRAKFVSFALRFHETIDLDRDLPCIKVFGATPAQREHCFDDQSFGGIVGLHIM